jgi:2-keto-4-pentenoate hydratase/2-oxohepta-3-ene-1,7-dioic acid hydratase in catechol pathway
MRWVTYCSPVSGEERIGVIDESSVYGLRASLRLVDLLAEGPETFGAAASSARLDPHEVVPLDRVQLQAPIATPPSVRDFMAFEEHVVTSMQAAGRPVDPFWYEAPVFYFTNPAAVQGPHQPVTIPPGCVAFDYELEVAAIIGTPGGNLTVAEAPDHIAGYTILCDWTARDLQAREMAVGLGPAKGKDAATTLGPYLVTSDLLADRTSSTGFDLAMTATVNGRPYSQGNLADLHWSFAEMVSYASRGTRLTAGDVIGSGTVGTGCILELGELYGRGSYPWLSPGDEVHLEVERLGSLTIPVAATV